MRTYFGIGRTSKLAATSIVRSVMLGEEKACVVIHGRKQLLSRKASIFQRLIKRCTDI